jgi:hypothetical protein
MNGRIGFHDAHAQQSASDFAQVAQRLLGMIEAQQRAVNEAMANFEANDVSPELQAKCSSWDEKANQVKAMVDNMRKSIDEAISVSQTAQATAAKAAAGMPG